MKTDVSREEAAKTISEVLVEKEKSVDCYSCKWNNRKVRQDYIYKYNINPCGDCGITDCWWRLSEDYAKELAEDILKRFEYNDNKNKGEQNEKEKSV